VNRTPEPAAQLAADGATAHEDPRDAVRHADVVITMIADAAAVNQVAFECGMLEAMRPEAAWSQMSTIGVSASEELAARVGKERPDVYFADAPVSGTRGPAENGQLLILASGPDAEARARAGVRRAGPGDQVAGPVGAGKLIKLVMNSWLVILVEGAAEIMAPPTRSAWTMCGWRTLSAGNPANPAAAVKFAKMDAVMTPDFSLQWALKDIRLALDDSGRRLPALDTVRDRWAALVDQGLGARDVAAARHGLG
jgi:3-hydroxyisobutyrate dehydrogenase